MQDARCWGDEMLRYQNVERWGYLEIRYCERRDAAEVKWWEIRVLGGQVMGKKVSGKVMLS